MTIQQGVSRRNVLVGAATGIAAAATGLLPTAAAEAAAVQPPLGVKVPALWHAAARRGILYGSSIATWQIEDDDTGTISDTGYANLFAHHAALLFTEDDLLWWRIKPKPNSDLDFTHPDRIYAFAEKNDQLVYGGPGLVWDDGFGDGWSHKELWDITEKRARHILYDTLRQVMQRYSGRTAVWAVVNEAIVNGTDTGHQGLRTDVPWFKTIGPEYVAHAFREARKADPHGVLLLNDFGYETVSQYGDRPIDKMRATLEVIDKLQKDDVPLDAFGIQAHLLADRFAERFSSKQYQHFIRELGDRGLEVLITEMDVLDDGLPADIPKRDEAVANVYATYLDAALQETDIAALMTFGLSDRYTWLQEDYPRADGAARRPLPFDDKMKPTPALSALRSSLGDAAQRTPFWVPPRCS